MRATHKGGGAQLRIPDTFAPRATGDLSRALEALEAAGKLESYLEQDDDPTPEEIAELDERIGRAREFRNESFDDMQRRVSETPRKTVDKAAVIAAHKAGASYAELAEKYGVDKSHIGKIRRGER